MVMCPCAVYVAKQILRTVFLWVNSFYLSQRSTCWDFSADFEPWRSNNIFGNVYLRALIRETVLLVCTFSYSSTCDSSSSPGLSRLNLPGPTHTASPQPPTCSLAPTCFPLAGCSSPSSPPLTDEPSKQLAPIPLLPGFPLKSDPFSMHYKIRDE